MSFNLIEAVKEYFTDDLSNKMAIAFDEKETAVHKAVEGAIPAVVAGLLNKGGTADGNLQLMGLLEEGAGSSILSNFGNLLGGGALLGKGMELLKNLFSDRTHSITTALARYAGIRESSSSSILSAAVPVALGTLGREVLGRKLNISGLATILAQQKENLLSQIPAGLDLSTALGIGSLDELGGTLAGILSGKTTKEKEPAILVAKTPGELGSYMRHTVGETSRRSEYGSGRKLRWLWPLVLALLVIVALVWYLQTKDQAARTPAAIEQSPVSDSAVSAKE